MTSTTRYEIIRLRRTLHLDYETWRRWTLFSARLFLQFAPLEVRPLFLGAPSHVSPEAVEVAEAFALLRAKAEDKTEVTEVRYSLAELWKEAVELQREAQND
ncbi:MAG: hypothetical protein SAMD01599839_05760 [Rectinema sp.]|jgi:hypothetical protein